jgi:glucose-1-phosphate thymidylyltransferase
VPPHGRGAAGAQREPLVGLIPAAGRASRLGRLPCSKEILPLVSRPLAEGGPARPLTACELLLEAMGAAGVRQAFIALRPGKWDIPAYLGAEHRGPVHAQAGGPSATPEEPVSIAYLLAEDSPSVPHTLDRAYPFIAGRHVALGFPDILIRPADALAQLARRQADSGSDVVLGLFPASEPDRSDLVEVARDGKVRRLLIKQDSRRRRLAPRPMWGLAVWSPRFTEHLHAFLARPGGASGADGAAELWISEVIQAGIDDGLAVEAVRIRGGACLDVGTPEAVARAATWQAGDARRAWRRRPG